MIRFRHKGDFSRTERFFERAKDKAYLNVLKRYGQAGVEVLASATPKDSGETAASWGYEIAQTERGYALYFTNTNIHQCVNIAMILQTGHGTGTGGYVRGIDYIAPAIRPIFEKLANDAWREVTSL